MLDIIQNVNNFQAPTAELNVVSEEKVVGTWIDGQLLYQRVITGTTGSGSSSTVIPWVPDLGVKIRFLKGYCYYNDSKTNGKLRISYPWNYNCFIVAIQVVEDPSRGSGIWVTTSTGSSSLFVSREFLIVVNYTKD